eukprot:scaffold15565_cov70-Cylindrotheca_fusiformis.AAC.1
MADLSRRFRTSKEKRPAFYYICGKHTSFKQRRKEQPLGCLVVNGKNIPWDQCLIICFHVWPVMTLNKCGKKIPWDRCNSLDLGYHTRMEEYPLGSMPGCSFK